MAEPIVEFRNPQPAPTEPGWYYARRSGYERIEPVQVHKTGGWPIGSQNTVSVGEPDGPRFSTSWFTWFGPVAEVREG